MLPLDFLDLNSIWTPEQKLLSQSCREHLQEMRKEIAAHYLSENFPGEIVKKFGQWGFLGAFLDHPSCLNLDATSYGLMLKEIERVDSGLRSFASVQGALVMYPIATYGSDEQKNTWISRLAKGEAVGCFGLTESYGGSDPSAMKTVAKKNGDDWIISGSKMWITNGCIADVAVVWAHTDDGVRGFLIPKGAKGYSTVRMKGKLSMRASITSELYFDQVRVHSKDALLPNVQGMKGPLSCLNQARFGIAWGVLGAAEDCLTEVLEYVKSRKIFSEFLSEKQLIQRRLAIMVSDLTKAQLLARRLGELKNENALQPAQISLAKQNNVEAALNIARTCRDMLGANGIMAEYRSMRHMCNLESVSTYEGTNDIHLLVIGQAITGSSAY